MRRPLWGPRVLTPRCWGCSSACPAPPPPGASQQSPGRQLCRHPGRSSGVACCLWPVVSVGGAPFPGPQLSPAKLGRGTQNSAPRPRGGPGHHCAEKQRAQTGRRVGPGRLVGLGGSPPTTGVPSTHSGGPVEPRAWAAFTSRPPACPQVLVLPPHPQVHVRGRGKGPRPQAPGPSSWDRICPGLAGLPVPGFPGVPHRPAPAPPAFLISPECPLLPCPHGACATRPSPLSGFRGVLLTGVSYPQTARACMHAAWVVGSRWVRRCSPLCLRPPTRVDDEP